MTGWIKLTAPLALAACMAEQEPVPIIGVPDPSAVYCESIGGLFETQSTPGGGNAGYCRLPDGRVVDSWELFTEAQGGE